MGSRAIGCMRNLTIEKVIEKVNDEEKVIKESDG